jgi:MinD superfamily P-loop ATPase
MSGFQIAVAGGKSGTGVTTVATSLALSIAGRFSEAQYLDCDIQFPEGALFLKPIIESSSPVEVPAPVVDEDACTGCGECQAACQYNAIRLGAGKACLSTEACTACGACVLACPEDAIMEEARSIGALERGRAENLVFSRAARASGWPISTRLVRAMKAAARADIPTVVDCGSGTTPQVIAAMRGSDCCILVAEPTPLGLNDLKLIRAVAADTGLPAGIIVNKDDSFAAGIETYAEENGDPILMRIPFSKEIAHLGALGVTLTEADKAWDEAFWKVYEKLARAI